MRHCLATLLALFALSFSLPGATVLTFNPSSANESLGQRFAINVTVSGVSDLASYQFDVGFDPTILSAQSITEGSLLPTGGATLFLPGTIDNSSGQITFTFDSLQGNVPGVSGNGVLATIDFTAIGRGTSALSLFNVTLLDSNLLAIANSTTAGQVIVTGTPEPVTPLLVLSGLSLILFAKSRKLTAIRRDARVN